MPTMEPRAGSTAPPLRTLTGEEEALYDRQIRLWGVEAQRKLSTSNVLLVCNPTSLLAQEIAKNLVLAGIASLTFHQRAANKSYDDANGTIRAGFLGTTGNAVMTSLQEMNPLVKVALVIEEPPLSDFTVVCCMEAVLRDELLLSEKCRKANIPFMCGRVAGGVGWLFLDVGQNYEYAHAKKQNEDGTPVLETVSHASYPECMDAKWGGEVRRGEFGWHVACTLQLYEGETGIMPSSSDSDMNRVCYLYEELCKEKGATCLQEETVHRAARASRFALPPVTGIVGGMWGREVIKIVSGRGCPLDKYNFFFFNSATSVGSIERVGPKIA